MSLETCNILFLSSDICENCDCEKSEAKDTEEDINTGDVIIW